MIWYGMDMSVWNFDGFFPFAVLRSVEETSMFHKYYYGKVVSPPDFQVVCIWPRWSVHCGKGKGSWQCDRYGKGTIGAILGTNLLTRTVFQANPTSLLILYPYGYALYLEFFLILSCRSIADKQSCLRELSPCGYFSWSSFRRSLTC
jgi:hypothetical protein